MHGCVSGFTRCDGIFRNMCIHPAHLRIRLPISTPHSILPLKATSVSKKYKFLRLIKGHGDPNMIWGFSALNTEQVKAIKQLEDKLGITLLAFSGTNLKYADLSAEELDEMHKLEKELNLSLVAVKV
jgi:hypothetical protein